MSTNRKLKIKKTLERPFLLLVGRRNAERSSCGPRRRTVFFVSPFLFFFFFVFVFNAYTRTAGKRNGFSSRCHALIDRTSLGRAGVKKTRYGRPKRNYSRIIVTNERSFIRRVAGPNGTSN